jgi:hypothetical protein
MDGEVLRYIYIGAKLFNAFATPIMAGIPNAEKLD